MERLHQEFPRHNWLENKYKEEGSPDENVPEIELSKPKLEAKTTIVSKKSEYKPRDKRRKKVAIVEKKKLKPEHITMDMEVSTTTTDEQQRLEGKGDMLNCSSNSEEQEDLLTNTQEIQTPDSTPNQR